MAPLPYHHFNSIHHNEQKHTTGDFCKEPYLIRPIPDLQYTPLLTMMTHITDTLHVFYHNRS